MYKISNLSRILLAVGAVALLGMLILPIWSIYLTAPQYPEGLEMKIWHNTLTGDVKIISALNHYIGMRAISVEMFPEFKYIGILVGVAAGICLILALIGRWWSALAYFITLAIGDSAALYDFWRWGYDYGHNLDPTAAIVIPGMAYQPPVIGYKKLLNFEAWSLPDAGGWILMGVTTMALLIVVYEWWKHRKGKVSAVNTAAAVAAILLMTMSAGCSSGPQPIAYGKDNCEFCKMTLMDRHYGAELTTKKGKVYKFDDLNCFVMFEKAGSVAADQVAGRYVTDFSKEATLIPAETAIYLSSENLKSPMASGIAAFSDASGMAAIQQELGGSQIGWPEVQTKF